MHPQQRPSVGQWYRDVGDGQVFQVVAVDAHDASIELQYFDGTLGERRLTEWYALDVEATEPPQDWTGPFDGVAREDVADDAQVPAADWDEPYATARDAGIDEDAAFEPSDGDVALLDAALLEYDAPAESPIVRAPPARASRATVARSHDD
ncbi:DUF6763 family protein [Solimonas soli]|uniref:DUF6763 family protein n=1 Tax=Solimonas soli TaxID=413479 RepID=UPI0004AE1E62|nr:DUF6763 family protein [Solimonas soli]